MLYEVITTHLYLYEVLPENSMEKAGHRERALSFLREAEQSWKNYADASTPRYKPQLLARTDWMDWNVRMADVRNDTSIAEASTGRPPRIVKLFMYSKNHPALSDRLKTAFKEKGYIPQEHQAWQWKSYANFELAVLTASYNFV